MSSAVRRLRGTAFKTQLPRLPRNLVAFDGHCLMCQARVIFVLECNFSYFHIATYFRNGAEGREEARPDRHRMHFASLDRVEGRELERVFLKPPAATAPGSSNSSSSSGSSKGKGAVVAAPGEEEELAVMLVEKAPSSRMAFLRRAGQRQSLNPFGLNGGKGVNGVLRASALMRPEDVDLVVSTNYAAMCPIGMHLDRVCMRACLRELYYLVLRCAGDWCPGATCASGGDTAGAAPRRTRCCGSGASTA